MTPTSSQPESQPQIQRPGLNLPWSAIQSQLQQQFPHLPPSYYSLSPPPLSSSQLQQIYRTMYLCRTFETACAKAYQDGHIRGFMHLDNGQESVPSLLNLHLSPSDLKFSYYRAHCHALACGSSARSIMSELFMKVTGLCRGAGGSMHLFDKANNFQGGWALVAEQLPYAAGGATALMLDAELGLHSGGSLPSPPPVGRVSVVLVGEGGAQNGRLSEVLNAASVGKLPLLIIVIDNGRAINTFTPDVAANSDVYKLGKHYGVPGVLVDGTDAIAVARAGEAMIKHIREGGGPAILQVHTYRFNGHSPADPEHEVGRKEEKKWARQDQDPIKHFEDQMEALSGSAEPGLSAATLAEIRQSVHDEVKDAVNFALNSFMPPPELAKILEYPDPPDTDYNLRPPPPFAEATNRETISPEKLSRVQQHIANLRLKATNGEINIGDAVNLAIHEEMLRDPSTTLHAEDLQAGSSYNIPTLTQQTYGKRRAADEIIDEGHFIGKALGEGLNGYRPIVELMNTNFGIYGMAEISSAGNTYATTGGQFQMPLTIIGAGGTAPNQSLGAEHSQPFHAYVMGIPGLKICTASSPAAAYGLTKSMIRDNGPCFLFTPVKMMKVEKGTVELDRCLPLNKAEVLHTASDESVKRKKAVTVLTYLHGVKESRLALPLILSSGADIDLIELRSLKPLDVEAIRASLLRTHKVVILDESTRTGGVGASISAILSEDMFDELDAPVVRLCMDDAPVPYASSMEKSVVKRAEDLVDAVLELTNKKGR